MRTSDVTALERLLDVHFENPDVLAQAFVHTSYLNEARARPVDSNERLEFLGDAAIGFAVARELYRRFPQADEGQLTELRAHLVRWETLAAVAVRLQLGRYLVLGRGEEQSGGRSRPMNLARALEALVGAVVEDRTPAEADRLVLRLLEPELAALQTDSDLSDVKSRLQEWVQARLAQTPVYRTVAAEGPDHARVYRVEVRIGEQIAGTGSGPNKRTAERAAAAEALRELAADRP